MIQDDRLPLKEKFLEYFKTTPIQKYAAAHIGKNEDTILIWKKEDSDFSDQIDSLKAAFVTAKLKKIKDNQWILERLFKDSFSQRTEVTGEEGKPLVIEHHYVGGKQDPV